MYLLQKISISNADLFNSSNNPDFLKSQKYKAAQLFNNDNNKKCFLSTKSAYQIISEGSCDSEDWSNDAENSALPLQEYIFKY